MYLSIGGEYVVRLSEIVAVFDLDHTSVSKITREYLKYAEKNHVAVTVSEELPKSMLLTKDALYISPIAAPTLQKRMLTMMK